MATFGARPGADGVLRGQSVMRERVTITNVNGMKVNPIRVLIAPWIELCR
ncbi:hypothetical protein E3A20_11170 [Planctomyces bekefii]|uniref:Uncharacterized protein n=1 Tax=Planctomyces bekefii TaxID=1653850 RepID=A0A5C6M4N4_9PLAN|nr:hypothetical protein E3A20_11170 [Planctomyces bekefii]